MTGPSALPFAATFVGQMLWLWIQFDAERGKRERVEL